MRILKQPLPTTTTIKRAVIRALCLLALIPLVGVMLILLYLLVCLVYLLYCLFSLSSDRHTLPQILSAAPVAFAFLSWRDRRFRALWMPHARTAWSATRAASISASTTLVGCIISHEGVGDLLQEYADRALAQGSAAARRWLAGAVAHAIFDVLWMWLKGS